tara:strand:- start:108 stop:443 length:336 start_codon:yes stop_codon:yes gene_type:complete
MTTAQNTTLPILAEPCPLITFNVTQFNNIVEKVRSYSSSKGEEDGDRDVYAKGLILSNLEEVYNHLQNVQEIFSDIKNEGDDTTQHFVQAIPNSSRQLMNEISKILVLKNV